jgi:ribulose-5-phosphate 4-epimerase/fuculose-1-phosphate aldolase
MLLSDERQRLTAPGVAGHITVRDPVEPSSFWVNPFGVAFSQIKASDLIRVSHEGDVIEGGPCRLLNAAAFMIHSAIHAARPDVMCAAHSHSIHGRAFCTLGRPLDIISQDACAFHDVRIYISSLSSPSSSSRNSPLIP